MARAALRALLLAVLMCITLAAPGRAQEAALAPGDATAIRRVIESQLDAFRRDDAGAAYAGAAPGIRSMFPSADVFMDMVRRGYAPVYRSRSADFTALSMEEGLIVQRVELVGPDGDSHLALYTMQRQPDGTWRIAGVQLMDSLRVGT